MEITEKQYNELITDISEAKAFLNDVLQTLKGLNSPKKTITDGCGLVPQFSSIPMPKVTRPKENQIVNSITQEMEQMDEDKSLTGPFDKAVVKDKIELTRSALKDKVELTKSAVPMFIDVFCSTGDLCAVPCSGFYERFKGWFFMRFNIAPDYNVFCKTMSIMGFPKRLGIGCDEFYYQHICLKSGKK
jgi:hypothetical protein